MELSARNSLAGTVKAVKLGENEIVAAITRDSAERLKLSEGDQVFAVVKATEVMIAK
ncbi:MAG: TOBE domain-containing protein [Chloroflexota bacterium]|nr:TOBE domain-containing protein [Chloroflexota bacterium]